MVPIETRYKGYKFRSRLEARWAVFFDALGWQWLYEPEGFVLENGTTYLPDFYLPEIKSWIEVKPQNPGDSEINKCKQFAQNLKDGEYIILASGLPEPVSYRCFCGSAEPDNDVLETSVTITSYIRMKGWGMPYCGDFWDPWDLPCFETAKAARFEFGYSG